MKVKTTIISYQTNSAGCDKVLEDIINTRLKTLKISSDNLIDIKVNTTYCGDQLHHQINYLNVDASEILVRYTATIIYKVEE